MSDIIARAITRHGAKAVYDAAFARLSGDRQQLINIGLNAETLRDANEIMSIAYKSLTREQQAKDYWDAMNNLKSTD